MSKLPDSLTKKLEAKELSQAALFRTYEDLRRQSRDSEDFELHRLVGEAYRTFMRSFLNADERRFLDLEDEIAELRNELTQWRQGQKRIQP
ncbi:hypothetical protein [Methylobacterium sp. Leaf93]|uniref:hypothetical protein n=1 Tax=Methylobacterium sp. Leaf93 TaxID=1736249 RepID=UPI0006F44E0B|nr:hypothetical protein [Methylobacterium sp. Leaf93]KQP02640.1 hypothetical protein ASF26_14520 [Methylobacterium sp. Leaf93]